MVRPPALIGHAATLKNMATLYAAGKFPHAVLLHGAKGIGKRTLAEQVAQTLICGVEDGLTDTLSPNFLSAAYAQIMEGSNADYHILAPEKGKKSISIEQIRGLLGDTSLTSDTPRTIIIDAAEDLTPEAANALLKTLEEPTANTHFFLVCHGLSRLLPTIISRCRLMRLQPLTEAECKTVLDVQLPPSDSVMLPKLVAHCGGCPGVALSELENKTYEVRDALVAFTSAPHEPIKLVEQFQKKKQVPTALIVLQQMLATMPDKQPQYAYLTEGLKNLDIYNLSAPWVLEDALRQL